MQKVMPQVDVREGVAVAHARGSKHRFYEDAFRMLSRDVPLVGQHKRGEILSVFDGIGSAPEGRHAAQVMADALVGFYREPERFPLSVEGIIHLLEAANQDIFSWGMMEDADKPLGGCAGTVIWFYEENLHVFHAGDTAAVLIRDGNIKALTREHQTDDGAIFRYFGIGDHFKMDIEQLAVQEGDRILLMSDGVTKCSAPVEAGGIVGDAPLIRIAVRDLVHRCQLAGVTDDITAMLVEVEEFWCPQDVLSNDGNPYLQ